MLGKIKNACCPVSRQGDLFVASCPLLGVVSQGQTLQMAGINLAEALELFLEMCLEMGTLKEVLEEAGYQWLIKVD